MFPYFAAGCRFSRFYEKHSSPGIIDYVLDRLAPIVKMIMVYEKVSREQRKSCIVGILGVDGWGSGFRSRVVEVDCEFEVKEKVNVLCFAF
jgi:hypothetical protein